MSIEVKLPDRIKNDVEKQMAARGFKSASAYLAALVREDQRRLDQLALECQLLAGLESGSKTVDKQYWTRKRESLLKRHRKTQ